MCPSWWPPPQHLPRIFFNTLILSTFLLALLFSSVSIIAPPTLPFHSSALIAPPLLIAVLVVLTYGLGGTIRYGSHYGWAFFQPGRGGARFVYLQAASWISVSTSLCIALLDYWLHHPWPLACLVVSSGLGLVAHILTVTSLMAYQPPNQAFEYHFFLTHKPDFYVIFYYFMSFQISLAVYALFILWLTEQGPSVLLYPASLLVFVMCIATSVSLTHGVGGPVLHLSFRAYQPGRGGARFVLMQLVGWVSFGLAIVIALSRMGRFLGLGLPIVAFFAHLAPGPVQLGALGLFSQIVITLSLLVFEEDELSKAKRVYAKARLAERRAFLSCKTNLPAELKAKIYAFI